MLQHILDYHMNGAIIRSNSVVILHRGHIVSFKQNYTENYITVKRLKRSNVRKI